LSDSLERNGGEDSALQNQDKDFYDFVVKQYCHHKVLC